MARYTQKHWDDNDAESEISVLLSVLGNCLSITLPKGAASIGSP